MRKFAYIGSHGGTRLFGKLFANGQMVEVTDEAHAKKLAGNPDFSEEIDGAEIVDATDHPESSEAKRRGRPPKGE